MELFDYHEYLADYLNEAGEHLAALDAALLAAEETAVMGQRVSPNDLNAMFRAIHTVKGMAGMMGLGRTTDLAHEMEQIFTSVRAGERRLAPGDLLVLFDGLDALKALHKHLETDGSENGIEVAAALGSLTALAAAPPDRGPVTPVPAEMAASPQTQEAISADAHFPTPSVPQLPASDKVAGPQAEAPPPVEPHLAPAASPASPEAAAPLPPREAAKPADMPTIRVETSRIDQLMELVGELVIQHTRIGQVASDFNAALDGRQVPSPERLRELAIALDDAYQAVRRVGNELQETTVRVRMVPVHALFNRFPRIVRDVARDCGKRVRLRMQGTSTELDKSLIEQVADPLLHLIRNAIDHGIETPEAREERGKNPEGTLTLAATSQGNQIIIEVSDDGAGIDLSNILAKARERGLVGADETPDDHALSQLLFHPGFTTAEKVTAISGRGVGLDVVQLNIKQLGGSIHVDSTLGAGTRFVLTLPLTLAIIQALLVRAGPQTYALPLGVVEETLRVGPKDVKTVREQPVFQVGDDVLPFFALDELFDLERQAHGAFRPVVLVNAGDHRYGLAIDAMVGQQDIVVKSLGEFWGDTQGIGGGTILGDGRVALILDVHTLITPGATRHAEAR